MTISTEQIYDMEKEGRSVYDTLREPLIRGETVIIELPIPGKPSREVERLASVSDLDAWRQRYSDAESRLARLYGFDT